MDYIWGFRVLRNVLAAVFSGFVALVSGYPLPADADDKTEIEALLRDYGAKDVISVLIAKRDGYITTFVEGKYKRILGRPAPETITAETVSRDLTLARMSLQEFADAVKREHADQTKAAEKEKTASTRYDPNAPVTVIKTKGPDSSAIITRDQAIVRALLKDPESAKFSGSRAYQAGFGEAGYDTCGYVNAKNSYGGYTGDKRYFVFETQRGGRSALMGDDVYGAYELVNDRKIPLGTRVSDCFAKGK